MKLTEKRVLVNLPVGLYRKLRRLASKELRSVSSLIREAILRRVEESFSPAEKTLIERGRREFREGRGTDWRKKVEPGYSKEELEGLDRLHAESKQQREKVTAAFIGKVRAGKKLQNSSARSYADPLTSLTRKKAEPEKQIAFQLLQESRKYAQKTGLKPSDIKRAIRRTRRSSRFG